MYLPYARPRLSVFPCLSSHACIRFGAVCGAGRTYACTAVSWLGGYTTGGTAGVFMQCTTDETARSCRSRRPFSCNGRCLTDCGLSSRVSVCVYILGTSCVAYPSLEIRNSTPQLLGLVFVALAGVECVRRVDTLMLRPCVFHGLSMASKVGLATGVDVVSTLSIKIKRQCG